ncbi:hypothetical protein R75461_07313 [Paraburkholderia nemoris]|nr:hypothetical protein R75461_07313 [Paraburkholderia nemoris]
MMARQEAAAPQVDARLETNQRAAGARIGERLIAVVDLLAEQTHPAGAAPAVVAGSSLRLRQRVANALMHRAERGEAHLPRNRLHHAVGGDFRADDRIRAGRQRGGWRIGRENRAFWLARDQRRLAGDGRRLARDAGRTRHTRHNEVRAQEPVVRITAAQSPLEQPVVIGAGAQFARSLRKGPGVGSRAVDGRHNRDAVGRRQRPGATDVGHGQCGCPGRRAAVDQQAVRGGVIRAEGGVQGDGATLTDIAGRGQHGSGRGAGAHADQPGVGQAGERLAVAAQVERTGGVDSIVRVRAEDVGGAGRQGAAMDRGRAGIRAGARHDGFAAVDIDRAGAADGGRKSVVAARIGVIEHNVAGAGAERHGGRVERSRRSGRLAGGGSDVQRAGAGA